MPERPRKERKYGAAEAFVASKLAAGHVAFSLADLVKQAGLSITAARNQLLRMRDRVVRVCPKQQFFLIVTPEHAAMGAPPSQWWLDEYFKWLGHPYYLALQSAAETYGSSPQAIQVTQIMTDKPRRPISIGRIQVHFFVKIGIAQIPTQPQANAFAPLRVSTPEATAFDLVRYAARIGGIGRAAETMAPLLPQLNISEMKRVLRIENETSIIQRLGYVIETAGNEKLARAIHEMLPKNAPVIPLVPSKSRPESVTVIEHWRLVVNSEEINI